MNWKLVLLRYGHVPLLIAACFIVWQQSLSLVGDFQIDDAYITFAFSKNLASGNGPIYGYDMKVEGYSNFLWMVLVALGMLFQFDALSTARFLSHVALVGLLFATYRGAKCISNKLSAALAVLALASCTDLVRAAQSGLETVAFATFVAASVSAYLSETPSARRWSTGWAALAGLTRIDGFVFVALLAGLEALRSIAATRSLTKRYFIWVAWGAGPLIAYWGWRFAYYGLPLPLPYYAKASQTIAGASDGLSYLRAGILDLALWAPVFLAALGLPRPLDQRTTVLIALIAILTGYVVYVGGDWMPMHRMLLPLLVPLWMLASMGVRVLWLRTARRTMPRLVSRGFALVLVALAALHMNQSTIETSEEKTKVALAAELSRHTLGLLEALPFVQATQRVPGEKLVTDYGGVFAWGTEASVIEMWGLCNRDIALKGNTDGINGIYGKTCVPCYADFDPDYFHLMVPLLKPEGAIKSRRQAISGVFQGPALNRVLNIDKRFVLGSVTRVADRKTFYFLEKKRPGLSYEGRSVGELQVRYH